MNIAETTQALALAQAYDNRTVGEMNVRAWHAILADCDAADVMLAIREHYAEQTEWMMPAHILRSVRAMVEQRDRATRSTGWAPGQAGVPKGEALPEVTGPVDESALTPSVRSLLDSVRAMLPEGSREALMPRQVAWEREHQAYVRVRDGQPNPLYRPGEARKSGERVGCDWHEEGGYGFKWDCRHCNPDHPAYADQPEDAGSFTCNGCGEKLSPNGYHRDGRCSAW